MFNWAVFGDRRQAYEKQKQHYQRYEDKRVIHNMKDKAISARAWFSMPADGLYKEAEVLSLGISPRKLTSTFFSYLLFWDG